MGKIWDVLIIGAGPAGMMAAITAARNNKRVCIIEQKDKIGKKIYATGNGKCNYTNLVMDESCFFGDKEMWKFVYEQFTNRETIAFFRELGIVPKDKNGYIYPYSEQAASMVEALNMELSRRKVAIACNEKVIDIQKKGVSYEVKTSETLHKSTRLIIATGLKASPKLGSDGSLISVIANLGYHFEPIQSALCGFYAKGLNFKKLAGIRCDAKLSVLLDKNTVYEERGELQVTDYGISGIPVFQCSYWIEEGLLQKKDVGVVIDLFPEFTKEELIEEWTSRCNNFESKLQTAYLLKGMCNEKWILELLQLANIESKCLKDCSKEDFKLLADICKTVTVRIDKERDFEFAQVCKGGISSNQLNKQSLESLKDEGLYFAGEIIDMMGICGGYNLQWAWSSGYVAGKNASNSRKR